MFMQNLHAVIKETILTSSQLLNPRIMINAGNETITNNILINMTVMDASMLD